MLTTEKYSRQLNCLSPGDAIYYNGTPYIITSEMDGNENPKVVNLENGCMSVINKFDEADFYPKARINFE